MQICAVLFDVDETLFDRVLAQRLVLQRLPQDLPDLFGDLDFDTLWAAWEQSDRETSEHVATTSDIRASRNVRSEVFLRVLGMDAAHTDRVTDFYLDTYATIEAPVQGAVDVVRACAQRLPIGVVSNAYPDVQYSKLDTLGLRGLFRCVVLSEEYGGPRKPAAQIFLRACELLGSEPAQTLYVGDSFKNDVVGARAAGLIPCWYNPQSVAVPTGQTAPEIVLAEMRQLLSLV